MKVKLFTIADDSTEVWIDAFINDNRIDGYWIIPAYYDEEVELVVMK